MKRVTSNLMPAIVALVALFVAGSAQAAVITVSYVNGQISTSSNFAAATTTAVNLANPVALAPGQFFRFGLALQVTGNPNPEAGTAWDANNQTNNGAPAMPAQLGLAAIGVRVGSTDAAGANLAPLVLSGKTRLAFNNAAPLNWAVSDNGDVSGGIAGSPSSIFRGNGPPNVSTTAGIQLLGFYTTLANLFNTLPYGASPTAAGTVTLNPGLVLSDTLLWKRTAAGEDDGGGSNTADPVFTGTSLGGGDSVVLPAANSGGIIINFGAIPEPGSLAAMGFGLIGLLVRRRTV